MVTQKDALFRVRQGGLFKHIQKGCPVWQPQYWRITTCRNGFGNKHFSFLCYWLNRTGVTRQYLEQIAIVEIFYQ